MDLVLEIGYNVCWTRIVCRIGLGIIQREKQGAIGGMDLYYYIETWGCQMNEHDSEILGGMLEALGYRPTGNAEKADVMILNTCCVREKAENKVLGYLGELKRLKNVNPCLVIGVCGCMAQRAGMAEKIAQRAPHVDLIFGTHNLHRLPQLLAQARESSSTLVEIWDQEKEIAETLPVKRSSQIKAYVTITYGCNNFCSYCIVPYVRGRERSRWKDDILEEVRELAGEGCKEIMLLGQNVNSYGKDLPEPIDFADLLQSLEQVPGLERIRYMTSHPRDFDDKLIATIANSAKVCEHFHLPVQAGSNAVLERMNRGYSRETFLDLVTKVRRFVPNASITTDIIVGFPGESEEDFQATLDLVERVRFDTAYTFLYSPRPGTPAAAWDQVEEAVKKERFQRLLALQNRISWEINQELIDKREEILIEGVSKTDEKRLSGRTRSNKVVIVDGSEDLIGRLVPVRILEAQTWFLQGEIIS